MSEASKTVNQKLKELSEKVAWFQGTDFKLEDAVTQFQQAERLAEEIEKDLTKLKNDIKIVKTKFDSEA